MLTLFIYIPSAITMAAISDFFLSLLWGATAILSLVLCQLHCRHPQKQPVVIYILRTFAPKLSIVTLVCVMFADTVDSFNVCEMAACHDLYRAPDTPDALAGGIAFHATSSNSFGIYLCLASLPLVSVFFTLYRKKSALVACKIYIFLTFAY